ncbi:MAG: prepilin peptidase [Spirochaetales bacterium]|nr:prepilin peptidase [Spirochaetales bacterium]
MKSIIGSWLSFGILSALLIPVAIIDAKEKRIPDIFIIAGFIVIIPVRLFLADEVSFWFLLDGIVGFLFFAAIWFVTRGKIGLGDAKLSALLACGIGLPGWILTVFLASLTGSVTGLFLMQIKKWDRTMGIPFAPFLGIGFVIAYFLKDPLLRIIMYA